MYPEAYTLQMVLLAHEMQRVVSAFNNPMGNKVLLRAGIDAGPCAGDRVSSFCHFTQFGLALTRLLRGNGSCNRLANKPPPPKVDLL